MANLMRRPAWQLPARLATPEKMFLNRRRFLKEMGFCLGGLGVGTITSAFGAALDTDAAKNSSTRYPAPRNKTFNPGWRLTNEKAAASYNNFYEFSASKEDVRKLVPPFEISPWPIQIGGLVQKPLALDVQELIEQFPLEERVYRFRCVEAWAMIVPWTGFPFSKLIEKVAPKSEARFVRLESFHRPEQAPGIKQLPQSPWPYVEGLRLDEAVHPLTILVTGVYGKPLPKQHGAPLRLIVPWKYGYKSIKSITKIDFVSEQPATFWETLAPDEYPFQSNVNPKMTHPRWSQATERLIDTGDRVRTQLYNGYGDSVARLYSSG